MNAARYFDAWLPHLVPDRDERVVAAALSLRAGTPPMGIERTLLLHTASSDLRALGVADDDVVRVAGWRLTALPAPTTPDSAARLLDTATEVLDGIGRGRAEPALAKAAADARALVERNRARIAGRTPEGAVRGYSNHPDYAEVGSVRSSAELLQRISHLDGGSSTPAAAIDATPPLSTASETLAW